MHTHGCHKLPRKGAPREADGLPAKHISFLPAGRYDASPVAAPPRLSALAGGPLRSQAAGTAPPPPRRSPRTARHAREAGERRASTRGTCSRGRCRGRRQLSAPCAGGTLPQLRARALFMANRCCSRGCQPVCFVQVNTGVRLRCSLPYACSASAGEHTAHTCASGHCPKPASLAPGNLNKACLIQPGPPSSPLIVQSYSFRPLVFQ